MASDAELFAIKDRAAQALMRIPGVTGVGLGGRVRGGVRLQEGVVLKVYVERKRDAAEIDPSELIPTEMEGIPVDVAELHGTSIPLEAPPGFKAIPEGTWRDSSRHRPLKGGGRLQSELSGSGFGTLGCMLLDTSDATKVYGLTNWHVLIAGHNQVPTIDSTPAGQPEAGESITKCCSSNIGKVAGGGLGSGGGGVIPDVGAVLLDPGIEWCADILEIGAVSGTRNPGPDDASKHIAVVKRGAKSGLTGGFIESIATTPPPVENRTYTNVTVVVPNPDSSLPSGTQLYFVQSGDSGSMLVEEATNTVLGLIFAKPGAPDAQGRFAGYAFPIEDVIKGLSEQAELAVKVATAKAPGEVQTVKGAAMAAVPAEAAAILIDHPALAGAQTSRPTRVPIAAMSAEPPPEQALQGLQQGLDRSVRGRQLITLWLAHQHELLELVNNNRRVATAWHRSGASALAQILMRMLSQPELELPRTLDGNPLSVCVQRVCTSIERFASATLREDLAQVRGSLPELGGKRLEDVFAALEAS